MTLRRLLPALLVLAACWPAAASAAPDTVIDFEGIPPLATVANQYAGQGVLFGAASSFGLPVPPENCVTGGNAQAGGIAGTSLQVACFSGPAEFPNRKFATAFEFGTERRQVRFDINPRVAFSATIPATLRVYGIGAQLLEQRPLTLTRNVTQQVTVARPTQEIVAIVVFGGLDMFDAGEVLVDNVVATLDDVPPPPKWALALSTPSLAIVEGSTQAATVSVRRFNGSTGPVTLSVPELPPGIAATLFDPNPVTGRDPVALRITAQRPLAGLRQITVNASGGGGAGSGVVTQGVQTVTGIPAVTIAEGGRFTRTLAAGCGPQRFDESFDVRGGYNGAVSLSPIGAGGLSASSLPLVRNTTGDGLYTYSLQVDPGAASGIQSVRLRALPAGATPAELDVFFRVEPVTLAAVSPTTLSRPSLGNTGRVTVRGNFPAACPISFQDGQNQAWRVLERASTDVDGRQFDLWTLEVPQNAASGPLRLLSATGAELARTAALDITDHRNIHGLSQANSGAGARTASYSWADFERTFGTDDTDACFVFCVRDPIASDYYDTLRGQVTASPGAGLCAGWAIMSLRFRRALQRAADYETGRRRAWQIANLADGTAVKRDVVRWQTAQIDKFFADARTRAFARSAADERTLLKQGVAANVGGLYVAIRQGGSGHAVVAYGAQDINTPTGPGLTVAIYDPNQPYATAEETSNAVRTTALANSTITIQGDGSWAGASFPWSGNNGTLAVIDALPSSDAKLPADFSLASLFGNAGGTTPAQVSSIEVDGDPALDAAGNPRRGSGVVLDPLASGARPVPRFRLAEGRRYTLGVTGGASGRYSHSVIGDGAGVTVVGASTRRGAKDTISVRPGSPQLTFKSAGDGPVSYELTDDLGRASRTATVATDAGRGGDTVALRGGTLDVRHDGAPATMTITLGSVGEGLPGSVTTAPIRLGDGQRLALAPRRWSDLAGGVALTIRDARGRVIRRGVARLRTTTRVRLGAVAARRSGRGVRVSGRVIKRGSVPVLAAVVEQVRGTKVVARRARTLRGARVRNGRFAITVPPGRRLQGARLRVTVTLLDEAAGLASVRKQVALR